MVQTKVENTTELIRVDLVLYLLIMLNPTLLSILSKPYLDLHFLILNSTNTRGRRELILFHTHLLLVAKTVWKKW